MKSQGDMAKNVRETNENIREYTGDMEISGQHHLELMLYKWLE